MSDPMASSYAIRTWLDSPSGKSHLQILQIICSVLMMGVATAIVIFVILSPFREIDHEPNWVHFTLAMALTSTSLGVGFSLSSIKKPSSDPLQLAKHATWSWIITYATLEGPAFINLIFFTLVKSNLEKGILLGVTLCLLTLMIVRFPTHGRFLESLGASD